MKAIVISGPGKAELTEVAPDPLATGDVRIRLLATGICGTDLEILDGTMPYFTAGMAAYPVIPGHEWVGDVVETLDPRFGVGDRVVGECSVGCMQCEVCRAGNYHRCAARTETGILKRNGGFAESITFPGLFLHKISRSVPIEVAAMVEPAAVAFNGVRRAEVGPSDDLVVFGDGPIGLLVLLAGRVFGPRTITVVGNTPHRLDLARRLGADAVIDIGREPDLGSAMTRLGVSPSIAIEATGNPLAIESAVQTVATGGRIVALGLFAGQRSRNLDLDRIVTGEVTFRGALGSPGVWPTVIDLIERGRIDPAPLVSHRLPLSGFLDGIQRVKARDGVKTLLQHDLPLP